MAIERTRLANERTLLAYMRTAIVIFATGITMFKLVPDDELLIVVASFLTILSVVIFVLGIRLYTRTKKGISWKPSI